MNKVTNITYASSLTDICEKNSSFDKGVLRIAYAGANRNGSFISKETFEKCAETMYNCPIVCNYDRETDTLGGHDMEVVLGEDGTLRLINITTPVGCIPESANYWWDTVEEEDGTVHEYLFADALLWKRQEAYKKIKEDGITAHSMEITVKDGNLEDDGSYTINDFEFAAFALIGVEPCFESSALVFSDEVHLEFKRQLAEMMKDLKEFTSVQTPDPAPAEDRTEKGGNTALDENISEAFAAESTVDVTESVTSEETTDTFSAEETARADEPVQDESFELSGNIAHELQNALAAVKVERPWGECGRYFYIDHDDEKKEVICIDTVNNWNLFGYNYTKDGDAYKINFEDGKRKKLAYVDFDEGSTTAAEESINAFVKSLDDALCCALDDAKTAADNLNVRSTELENANVELSALREYKKAIEDEAAKREREEVFARFDDLNGIEAFEALKGDCASIGVDVLEEKCFAIRGKTVKPAKQTHEGTPKIKVSDHSHSDPYGGVIEKYVSD